MPFADLRQGRTLLAGAVTNRWTMELERRLRFQFKRGADLRYSIRDTTGEAEWEATAKADGSTGDDYILICRVRDSAAGRLLTDPGRLNGILDTLPAGWEARNLQVVFQVKVIGNTPGQPSVVATYVWKGAGVRRTKWGMSHAKHYWSDRRPLGDGPTDDRANREVERGLLDGQETRDEVEIATGSVGE